MTTSQAVYKKYNDRIDASTALVAEELNSVSRGKVMFAKLILNKYSETTYDNPVFNYIKYVLATPTQYFNPNKVELAYKDFKVSDHFKINTYTTDTNREVINIYNSFKKAVIKEAELNAQIREYNNSKISNRVFMYLYRKYFESVNVELLRTGHSLMFIKSNIYIKIKGKTRLSKAGKIDWGESLKVLKILAKDINPEALKEYESKTISKVEFLAKMKPLLYNKEDNPKGSKWIVYDNKTFDHWLIINKSMCTIENGTYLQVTPTNYVTNETKSQTDFVNNAKSVEEIITTRELGLRDKIRALENYNMDYCLNTFDNDL